MRGWARRAPLLLVGALGLRLVQCATDGAADDPNIGVPPRIDAPDAGDADTTDVHTNVGDAGPCDPKKPFGAPVRLAELDASAQAATPRLSHDELTIYFTTQGTSTDLAKVERTAPAGPFGPMTILPESTASDENDPMVSVDNLRLFFQSTRNGSSDIFTARRTTPSGAFGGVSPVVAVNTDAGESHAYYRQSAGELWFVRDEGPTTGYDIFVAKENDTGFAPPAKVSELNSPNNDFQPQISEDGLTVVFASDRAGGQGSVDLWIAKRATPTAPFSTPTNLTELNSPAVEYAGWLSADGCRIWFSSNRPDASAISSIYYAERPR